MTASSSSTVLVSQVEAARLLGVERTTIWRMCRRHDLDKVCIGRHALITRATIDAFVAAQVRDSSR